MLGRAKDAWRENYVLIGEIVPNDALRLVALRHPPRLLVLLQRRLWDRRQRLERRGTVHRRLHSNISRDIPVGHRFPGKAPSAGAAPTSLSPPAFCFGQCFPYTAFFLLAGTIDGGRRGSGTGGCPDLGRRSPRPCKQIQRERRSPVANAARCLETHSQVPGPEFSDLWVRILTT